MVLIIIEITGKLCSLSNNQFDTERPIKFILSFIMLKFIMYLNQKKKNYKLKLGKNEERLAWSIGLCYG